jgi:ketosteroid isomerase-like protein
MSLVPVRCAVLLVALVDAAFAQSSGRTNRPPESAAEREVLAVVDRVNSGDTALMRQAIADDYLTITSSGRFDRKSDALRLYGSRAIQIDSQSHTDRRVRMFGNTAVVTNVWRLFGRLNGRPSAGTLAETQILVKRNDRWQIVGSQSTPIQAPADTATILALEEAWRQASLHNDTAAFNRLMAPDQHAVRTDGVVETRDDRLRAFGSGQVVTKNLEFSDLHVRLAGDIAIVTGLAARADTTNLGARDIKYRYTRIWQRQGGTWRVIEFQSTRVDPGNLGVTPRRP